MDPALSGTLEGGMGQCVPAKDLLPSSAHDTNSCFSQELAVCFEISTFGANALRYFWMVGWTRTICVSQWAVILCCFQVGIKEKAREGLTWRGEAMQD